ncbi:recombinase family protein, partial [Klebsiella pneumoniae]
MFVFGYLRASTSEQDASRAKNVLKAFANQHGHRIAGWYIDNVSGTTMNRPEPRQPGGCKLKTAPVRPVVAARPA